MDCRKQEVNSTKTVFIAEKPSVARSFASALGKNFRSADGYMESGDTIVTWCVGHLVSMSYPDAYDASLRKWSMETIPFIPDKYKYQVIDSVKKQFGIVKRILTDPEVDTIYICTDSGREGEYIYRLVASQAGVRGKKELRVWIDSQTQEEILRGIREAKPSSAYDNLGAAAYLRAQEDYLMGINFSRALTLRYSDAMSRALGTDHTVIAVGRVMTCVLGMVVRREREIRSFVKTPFFRVQAVISQQDPQASFTAQWQVDEKSIYYASPRLYKDTGFLKKEDAERLILYLAGRELPGEAGAAGTVSVSPESSFSELSSPESLSGSQAEASGTAGTASVTPGSGSEDQTETSLPAGPGGKSPVPAGLFREAAASRAPAVIEKIQRKKEKKNPPLLYNLAELQNDCSRFFKISPDQTLAVAQELYEKKLTTYPRTDARVLTTAVAKEIGNNLRGISTIPVYRDLLLPVLESGSWKKIGKTRYTNDKAVTDHYAIIPTGQGLKALPSLSKRSQNVYELIVRRFISIFYPPAVYDRITVSIRVRTELFTASLRTCVERGYLDALEYSFFRKKDSPGRISDGKEPDPSENEAVSGSSGGSGSPNDNGGSGDPGNMAQGSGNTGAEKTQKAVADDNSEDVRIPEFLKTARKGTKVLAGPFSIREGETAPPKRYTSGSMILAMENAGQLIEEEELREQIRGSGIGTSATRAEILKKLFNNDYLRLNSKTQVITPSQTGEMIFDTCSCALKPLLDPRLTASWELGLTQVAGGTVTSEEYTQKLNSFITRRTNYIKETDFHGILAQQYAHDASLYPEKASSGGGRRSASGSSAKASSGSGRRSASGSDGSTAKASRTRSPAKKK
ncbi:MAG: DNA topoisomerase [Eubacteriales bacterium]|nr:DNA topoisomerase [Eubacteriales bacterium]